MQKPSLRSLDRYAGSYGDFVRVAPEPHSGPRRAKRAKEILRTSQGLCRDIKGQSPWLVTGLVIAALAVIGAQSLANAQQAGVERKVLLEQDLTIPGYQAVLVAVTIPVGGREGRHLHPGTVLVHVQEGALTLDHDGRPTVTYKASESLFVEPGKVHEGINRGSTPVKAIATFIVE